MRMNKYVRYECVNRAHVRSWEREKERGHVSSDDLLSSKASKEKLGRSSL